MNARQTSFAGQDANNKCFSSNKAHIKRKARLAAEEGSKAVMKANAVYLANLRKELGISSTTKPVRVVARNFMGRGFLIHEEIAELKSHERIRLADRLTQRNEPKLAAMFALIDRITQKALATPRAATILDKEPDFSEFTTIKDSLTLDDWEEAKQTAKITKGEDVLLDTIRSKVYNADSLEPNSVFFTTAEDKFKANVQHLVNSGELQVLKTRHGFPAVQHSPFRFAKRIQNHRRKLKAFVKTISASIPKMQHPQHASGYLDKSGRFKPKKNCPRATAVLSKAQGKGKKATKVIMNGFWLDRAFLVRSIYSDDTGAGEHRKAEPNDAEAWNPSISFVHAYEAKGCKTYRTIGFKGWLCIDSRQAKTIFGLYRNHSPKGFPRDRQFSPPIAGTVRRGNHIKGNGQLVEQFGNPDHLGVFYARETRSLKQGRPSLVRRDIKRWRKLNVLETTLEASRLTV